MKSQRIQGKGMVLIRMDIRNLVIPPSHFTDKKLDGQRSEMTCRHMQEISQRHEKESLFFFLILAFLTWDFIQYSGCLQRSFLGSQVMALSQIITQKINKEIQVVFGCPSPHPPSILRISPPSSQIYSQSHHPVRQSRQLP